MTALTAILVPISIYAVLMCFEHERKRDLKRKKENK